MERLTVDALEWAVSARAFDHAGSGDGCVVQPFPEGVLVASVDGTGHGAEAQDAACLAMEVLRAFAHERPAALVARCHANLRSTRGVALSLASIDTQRHAMTWLGVGNMTGILARATGDADIAPERLIPGMGIVGRSIPHPATTVHVLRAGDTLIFATDGVRADFAHGARAGDDPRHLADRILARHATGTDDALVVVARYRGGAA